MDYDVPPESPTLPTAEPLTRPATPEGEKTKRRILPNAEDFNEYTHWKENVKDMVDPYLSYTNKSLVKPAERADVIERVRCECVELKTASLTCPYFDRTSFMPFFPISMLIRSPGRPLQARCSPLRVPTPASSPRTPRSLPLSPAASKDCRLSETFGSLPRYV